MADSRRTETPPLSEAAVAKLAPAGTKWHFVFDPNPGRVDESLGVYANWRDRREWDESVEPHPVLWFRNTQGSYVDHFTVEPSWIQDGTYEQVSA